MSQEELGAAFQAGPEAWTVEDLDKVLEHGAEENPAMADHKSWLEGEGDLFGTEELFQNHKPEDLD